MTKKIRTRYARGRGKANRFAEGGVTIPTLDSYINGLDVNDLVADSSFKDVGSTPIINKRGNGGGNARQSLDLFNPLIAGINAATSFVGTKIGKGISGGKTSGVGNFVNGLGDSLNSVPIFGGIASGALNIVGGGINALVGSKINQENVNKVNANINELNNFQSNFSDFDSAMANSGNISTMGFSKKDIGSDGLFSNKAKKKYNELKKKQEKATTYADNSVLNNYDNIAETQNLNALANYSAYGGQLDVDTGTYTPVMPVPQMTLFADGGKIRVNPDNEGKFTEAAKRAGMGVQEYAAHVLANKEKYSPTLVKRANFARNASKWHAFGGDLMTNGGDFSSGYTLISNGGSHEANPYEGVQIGVDRQGVPNLVEEGEVVYDNYVFSDRLTVPKDVKEKYKLGKGDVTFADAFKKLSKEADERPNDPISKNGMDAFAKGLMASQEDARVKKQEKAMRRQFNALPTEDKATLLQGMADQAAQQQVAQQQAMTQGVGDIAGGYAHGGKLGTLFDDGGDENENQFEDPYYLNPAFSRTASFWDGEKYVDLPTTLFSNQWYDPYGNRQRGVNATAGYTPWMTVNTQSLERKLEAPTVSDPTVKPYWQRQVEAQSDVNNKASGFIDEAERNTGLNLNANDPRVQIVNNDANNTGSDDNPGYLPTWMRYAPAVGAGVGVLQNLFSKPDYTAANKVENAAKAAAQYDRVRYNPIGNYLIYNPLDRQYAINLLNAQSGATRRGIMNAGAGNRGQAIAGLLAADYNAGNQMGSLFRNAVESNLQQRQNVETFNRATNQMNSEGFLKAAMANQGARQQAAGQYLSGISQAMALRNAVDQQRAQSLSANLSNLFTSLGNIGTENYNRNDMNMLTRSGYFGTLHSRPQWMSKKEWEAYKKDQQAWLKESQALRNKKGDE